MKTYSYSGFALAIISAAGSNLAQAAPPTLTTIYSFQGGSDGATPGSALAVDKAGNLYGVTQAGGTVGPDGQCVSECSAVFVLSPPAPGQTTWTKTLIDGNAHFPVGGPVIDPSTGNLFTQTEQGGLPYDPCASTGCGTIVEYTPPTAGQAYWNKVVLHEFDPSGYDGYEPSGQLTRGPQGTLYGTTARGEDGQFAGYGTVFRLTYNAKYSAWIETVLWSFFNSPDDGAAPKQGVTADADGNVYGASSAGPASATCGGSIFKIVPSVFRHAFGTLTNLYHLAGGAIGCQVTGVLREDAKGVFYGTTSDAGPQQAGEVFTLSPPAAGSTAWTAASLHDFKLGNQGSHPDAGVIADTFGKLYGTTAGYATKTYPVRGASVFELAPPVPGTTAWDWKKLATFDGANGASPMSRLIIAPNGKLYGTTPTGGAYNQGTIFEVTR